MTLDNEIYMLGFAMIIGFAYLEGDSDFQSYIII